MDKIEKKQEEIMDQLARILELMSTDKEKRVMGSSSMPEKVQPSKFNAEPKYLLGFTPLPLRNALVPMLQAGPYPFFIMSLFTGPPPIYVQPRLIRGTSLSDPISVPDLDDPKEQ
ncbi:Uncharacterized protein TCM_003000 [Theobroma cacao]|uniref:Uncharacterized protein n=1 Tax=Theobroma cacao TaxID=3641 RepID=A0A061DPF3_THECC|nr:Uncharacterized protein TCM_003000 [Theobroma cacao]